MSRAARQDAPTTDPEGRTGRTGSSGSSGRATGRPLPVQAKLEVGSAHDPLEREADRAAEAFLAWQRTAAPAGGADGADEDTTEGAGTGRVRRAATASPAGAVTPPAARVSRLVQRDGDDDKKEGSIEKPVAGGLAGTAAVVAVNNGTEIVDAASGAFSSGAAAAATGMAASSVFGLLAQTIPAFADAVRVLFSAHMNHAAEDQLLAAERLVSSTGSMLQKAVSTADAAKATLPATLLPGLDLAVALAAMIVDLTKLTELWGAHRANGKAIEAARAAANTDVAAAAELIQSRTDRQIGLALVSLAADITMLTGAVATLATGPFGVAVKGVGGLVKLSTFFANQWMKSRDGKAAAKADKEFDKAVATNDADEVAVANTARLSADDKAAVIEILSLAVTPDGGGKLHPQLVDMVAAYGIGPNWLARYAAAGKPQDMLVEAEEMMLRYLGKDPQSTLGKITSFLSTAWKKLTLQDTTKKTKTPEQVAIDVGLVAQPAVDAYVATAGVEVTPNTLNRSLAALVTKLRLTYLPAKATDADDYAAKLHAIDTGLQHAIEFVGLPGVDLTTLKVVDGQATFAVSDEAALSEAADVILGPTRK